VLKFQVVCPNDGLSSKKPMLIDSVINAVHEYIDLLDNSRDFCAVGKRGKDINSVQLLSYNRTTGLCKACNYYIKY